jgi:hypothetical protein
MKIRPYTLKQMESPAAFKKINIILVMCVLGSLFRLGYCWVHTPWKFAPDHMAWEILLDESIKEGDFSYSHLIHYPHEGGTIVVSLFSLLINFFTPLNSLAIAAFILDFLSRLIQLYVVKKIFTNKVSLAFGLWTIFAMPCIIPWAGVSFGLHSISSLFPFVFMYLIWKDGASHRHSVIMGLFLGLAVWFSYANIPLIPVYLSSGAHQSHICDCVTPHR